MRLSGLWRITRPVNSIVAGIAGLLGYLIAAGALAPEALILIPIIAFITAGGNVVNDYCDRAIDAINRPDRPIPSGDISPRAALIFSGSLFAAGLATCLFASPLCLAIAIFNSVLLVLYAVSFKRLPLVGNAAVSYLSASIFLFGGALISSAGLVQNLPVAAITFLAMLSRELFKDIEDMQGDQEGGARTLPMLTGVKSTGILALVLAACAVLASWLPVMRWWGPAYLFAITICDAVILAGALQAFQCPDSACMRRTNATSVLKYGMFLALAVFLVAAILSPVVT
jgi:geranylgeranylglycerol-phosphate geranylgeranyltransferase